MGLVAPLGLKSAGHSADSGLSSDDGVKPAIPSTSAFPTGNVTVVSQIYTLFALTRTEMPAAMPSASLNSASTMKTMRKPRKCQRPSRTCTECQRRKVKCNRAEPCQNCTLFKKRCIYKSDLVSTFSPLRCQAVSSTPGVSPKAGVSRQLDLHAKTPIEPDDNTTDTSSPHTDSSLGSFQRWRIPYATVGQDLGRTDLSCRVQLLEQVFSTCALGLAGRRDIFSKESSTLADGRATLNKTRIYGRSHWMNTSHDVCKPG